MEENSSKYPQEVVANIAQQIDMGMICFLNADTMEVESVLGESYDAYWSGDHAGLYREVNRKVLRWEHRIRIEPPESWQSFKIMERFIAHCVPDHDDIKVRLRNALSRRRPFQHFKSAIDNSPYRQQWFDFKQSQLERLVREQLV